MSLFIEMLHVIDYRNRKNSRLF